MSRSSRLFAACLLTAVLVSCSSDDEEGGGPDGGTTSTADGGSSATDGGIGVYSCLATSGNCLEFIGSTYRSSNRRNVERTGCTQSGGTFQESACSSTGRLGRCIRDQGTASERVTHHYTGMASVLQMTCTSDGHVWAPN